MKPTILTFGLIRSEIDKYKKENNSGKDSSAFLEYVIEKLLELNRDEVLESIIDGSHDRGIDAIYIDEDSEERPVVYLFQSKYYQSEEKFDRSLEGDALHKMQHAIDSLILKAPQTIHDANDFLLSKLKDIRGLSNPRFQIIFCSNSAEPNSDVKKQFESYIKEVSNGQDYFRVDYVTLQKLNELITPVTTKTINASLKLSGQYIDWSLGEARVVIGRISGREIAELCKREGRELFDRNVRGYFGRKSNAVNKEIYKTAVDSLEGSKFFFLNNGITMVCNGINYLAVKENPEIEVSNLQIVNGGQTTNAIYEAYISGALDDSVYVLVKIVATENRQLVERIAESTNTQTLVRTRDLRSNDQIQKTIERMLLNKGYFYETRPNKYKESPLARGKRIDMEVAAQAYYAFWNKKPADAKNKKKLLFGSLYEEVFKGDDIEIADNVLLAHLTLEWVRKLHPNFREKYTFIKYAEYHSIALLANFGIKSVSDLENKNSEKLYKLILRATAKIVAEENKKMSDQYSHRMLFIDPSTYGRISEAVFQLQGN